LTAPHAQTINLLDRIRICRTLYTVISYEVDIQKAYKKGKLPKPIFEQFHHAFQALDLTKDMSMFDIKTLKGNPGDDRVYYRLRKGKYRAIFYLEDMNFFIISLAKRDEVYKKWP